MINMADAGAASVFVTVGTTSFDRLVAEVCSSETRELLIELGYRRLVVQYGRGELAPESYRTKNFILEAFRYKDSILDDIKSASLVISHAGAGSVTETLREGRPLVVMVNEELMDNHQVELASQLAKDGHLFYGTCKELHGILRNMDINSLKTFAPGKPEKFALFLDKFMGVS